jgi:Cdc6-like AAA superfamily ATPase
LGEGKLGQIWGYLSRFWVVKFRFWVKKILKLFWSRVPRPLLNLVLILDETLNMIQNDNEEKVLILEIFGVS